MRIYMNKLFSIITLTLIIISCASVQPQLPNGTYYGFLPCPDCDGISYQLDFLKNSVFVARSRYGSNRDIILSQGTYTKDGTDILLIGDTGPADLSRLRIEGDTIRILDKNGKQLNGNRNALTPVKPEGFGMHLMPASLQNGFVAHGNEPSWSLKIHENNDLSFRTLDNHNYNLDLTVSEPQISEDGASVLYTTKTETTNLRVKLIHTKCMDSMSGEEFSYSVQISVLNEGSPQDAEDYIGCGNYTGDLRLNDIWILTHINGEIVEFRKEPPSLEFHIKEGRIVGFTGCNRLGGNFEFGDDKVIIDELFSTEMACPDPNPEFEYLRALSSKNLNYEIDQLTLKLWNNDYSLMFKKVD